MKLSQLNSNKPKMETIQALNDGADEEDFKQLLEILKDFGQVEVLYDPSNPKDKNVTADEVVDRYENFKKWHNALNGKGDEETGKDGSSTKRRVSDTAKGTVYNYVGVGKFKDSTGKWVDAIIYERDNHMYMREVTDFIDKFKKA